MGASVGGGGGWDDEDGGGFRPVAEINVTPMVDVMLVLLIIFMVAAPLMTVGVPLELPKTQAAKVSQPEQPTILSIDAEGRVFLAEEELTAEGILPRLQGIAAENADRVVLVRGDRTIQYGRIMEVMGQVSQAGFSKVSLIAEATPGAAPAASAPAAAPAP
jgi:biopolymer transport protein TolR